MPFCTVLEAIEEFRRGRMVILVDDESRENEGDLVLAAERVTPEAINLMLREGRGLLCLAMTPEKAAALGLSLQESENTTRYGTAFMNQIDATEGVTTGVSAADRARTVLTAVGDDCRPEELARPGHVMTLRALPGGVLVRAGQTEGSVDLARLAGLKPMAVIIEMMREDGTMARMPDLEQFAAARDLKICAIRDLIEHRRQTEKLVELDSTSRMPAESGEWTMKVYRSAVGPEIHVALTVGLEPGEKQAEPVLVRVHSECLTGDAFGSLRCDCGWQLRAAMKLIQAAGRGVVLYMRQEGLGIGLAGKCRAYELQDGGQDTVEANTELGYPADLRHYGIGAQILLDLGVRQIKLLTNNPRKIVGLAGYGLEVVERVSIQMPPTPANERYLRTKKEKLGHLLDIG